MVNQIPVQKRTNESISDQSCAARNEECLPLKLRSVNKRGTIDSIQIFLENGIIYPHYFLTIQESANSLSHP